MNFPKKSSSTHPILEQTCSTLLPSDLQIVHPRWAAAAVDRAIWRLLDFDHVTSALGSPLRPAPIHTLVTRSVYFLNGYSRKLCIRVYLYLHFALFVTVSCSIVGLDQSYLVSFVFFFPFSFLNLYA